MSWMQKLYQTYNAALAHNLKNTDAPLTPVGHTLQTAHIVVVIDGAGDFPDGTGDGTKNGGDAAGD